VVRNPINCWGNRKASCKWCDIERQIKCSDRNYWKEMRLDLKRWELDRVLQNIDRGKRR